MAARASVGENDLAALELRLIPAQEFVASRSVLELMRCTGLGQEQRDVEGLLLGRLPVRRVLLCHGNLDRRGAFAADQRIEMQQPFFAYLTGALINTVQRAQRSDRVGAVL